MSPLALAGIACGFLLLLPDDARARCKDDSICIDEIRAGDKLELRARNLIEYPITYTVKIRGNTRQGRNTVTNTLGPGESQQVMTLHGGGNRSSVSYSIDWTVGSRTARHDDDYVYRLPYAADKSYRVLQGYGARFSHTGLEEFAVDFDMPIGSPVHAARDGIVADLEESNSRGCWQDGCGKYANYLVVLHSDGTTGEYYHLDRNGVLVEVGETLRRGQEIARSGNTGHTTMPHLHFAVYRAVDWGRTQSIKVRFEGANGIIDRPRSGARYENPKGKGQ